MGIFYVSYDIDGGICHVAFDPELTIVPLVNRVIFQNGKGEPMGPFGKPMADAPAEITADDFARLQGQNLVLPNGSARFTYDLTNHQVIDHA